MSLDVAGTYKATDPVLVDGKKASLKLDVSGNLAVTASGGSTAANQTTLNTEIGIVTEAAPATDTASSGLNGRLQRIAQRLTSLIALVPAALGSLGGFKIEPLTVSPGGAYTDRSITNLAGTSETLMAANAARKILVIHNIGATSIAVNLTGGAASLTVGGSIALATNTSLVLDHYPPVGAITVIGTATADVTAYEG